MFLIHRCYVNIKVILSDNQYVAQNVQLGIIIALQKKKEQCDDVIEDCNWTNAKGERPKENQ